MIVKKPKILKKWKNQIILSIMEKSLVEKRRSHSFKNKVPIKDCK